jgi:Single-strand binding protein family
MRIRMVPRLLPPRPAPGQGVTGGELKLPDPAEEVNNAILSGTIVEEPLRDKSRDGDPITVLLVSFTAPDDKARRASACCEVEVPDPVADQCRRQLQAGGRVAVVGRLTGAGGLWATAIATRKPRLLTDR